MATEALLGGVIAGFVAIVIWAAFTFCWHRWRNWRNFGDLSGQYRIARKLADQPLAERASINVVGNVLKVEYECSEEDRSKGRSVVGEIAMHEHFPRSGEGYYSDTSNKRQLWGFWKLQIKDRDTLLVHTTYANHETHKLVTSGFVWSRIKAPGAS